jgi:DNA-binding LacI/PurR family transcriptional regulator
MECKFGVVKKVWLSENKVVLIHDPAFWETARNLEAYLREQGYDVVRLNTGVEEDSAEAEKLLEKCFEQSFE